MSNLDNLFARNSENKKAFEYLINTLRMSIRDWRGLTDDEKLDMIDYAKEEIKNNKEK